MDRGKTIASCNHEVSEGITSSRQESDHTEYGTYCHHCILSYYKNDSLINLELVELIELVQSNARKEVIKEIIELRESNEKLTNERDNLLGFKLPSLNCNPSRSKPYFIGLGLTGRITHLNTKNIFRLELRGDDEVEIFYNTGSAFHSMIANMSEEEYFELIDKLNEG